MCFNMNAGEPNSHILHQDYVPNIFPDIYKAKRATAADKQRFLCHCRRQAESKENLPPAIKTSCEVMCKIKANISSAKSALFENEANVQSSDTPSTSHTTAEQSTQTGEVVLCVQGTQTEEQECVEKGQQTDVTENVPRKQPQSSFNVSIIEGHNKNTKFYTGLSTWGLFLHLFMFLSPFATSISCTITMENQLFLTLVRLRLNLLYEDLAERFCISIGTVSHIFDCWLDILYSRLKFLIMWPSKAVVQHNLPKLFKQVYPSCRGIIDCSEVFIEMPTNFSARSQTYSNYKKHNTVKFLIAITPCGSISFLSRCWGGRVSDKILTQESGFFISFGTWRCNPCRPRFHNS